MDTPGLDVESVTGMVGGGAQVVVFTTGLWTPTGNRCAGHQDHRECPHRATWPIPPTRRQRRDRDGESFEQAAERLFEEMCELASGRPAAAERLGHREFAIHRRNPTI